MILLCLVLAEEVQIAIPIMKPTLEKVQLAGQTLPPGFPAPFLFADGLSSVETLLTNIQVRYIGACPKKSYGQICKNFGQVQINGANQEYFGASRLVPGQSREPFFTPGAEQHNEGSFDIHWI